jgi:hypothetical protein
MSYSGYRFHYTAIPTANHLPVVTAERAESPFVAITARQRLCILFVPLAVVLAVFAGQLLLPEDKSPWLLPSLSIFALLLSLPILFYHRSFGWFHPIVFTALMEIATLVSKLGMYINGLSSHAALPALDAVRLNELVAFELGLMALAFVSYLVGFHLIRGVSFPVVPFPKPERVRLATMCFVGFSAIAFLAYIQTKGGLGAHINDWSHRSVHMDGEGFWVPMTHAGAVACLYWLASDRNVLRSPVFWMCAIPALWINFFTSGGRSHMIFFAFYGAMIVMLRMRKVYFSQILVILGVALILVGILGNLRRSTYKGEVNWSTITEFNPFEAATGDATSEIARRSSSISAPLAILERVPREVPHLGGNSYLALLAFPIPQALWPGKPQGIDRLTGETFFGYTVGMPPGILGEAYWNFNIPGVIGAFLLFGLFHRFLMLFYLRNGDRPAAIVLYLVLVCILRGGTSTIPNLINILLPLALIIPLSARFSPRVEGRGRLRSQEITPVSLR